MQTFTLDPKPTFDLDVPVPIPGEGFLNVTFTCRYRNKKGFEELLDAIKDKNDKEIIFLIATGWNIGVDFNDENVEKLAENYMGSAAAIMNAYAEELMKVREKN